MRIWIVAGLMAATAMPTLAGAEPAARHREELRQGRQEIREGEREVQRDIRRGDWQEAREDRRELREDRHEYREDRKEYREHRRDAWKDYRAHNRHIYHRPPYVGPHDYRYRVWRPGVRLPAAYYAARYVIADPWHYRLPRPAPRERWVRYGNDVLLVDVRNGTIRDVIRDFFW